MRSVFVGGIWYTLSDIAKMCDLSIEELAYCSNTELTDIILNIIK